MAIEIRGIKKSFGEAVALSVPALTLPETGVFGICGASGSGKTTLLRLIAGLEKPDCGEITGTKDKKISFLFQEDRLLPGLTALQNVALVCDKSAASEILCKVGLSQDMNKYPAEMSGGMQRRVAFARAVAFGGDILLLDEPFEGLDSDLCAVLSDIIREKAADSLVILVTHNEALAKKTDKNFCL